MAKRVRHGIAKEQLGDWTVRLMNDGTLTIEHPSRVLVLPARAGNGGSAIELEVHTK